MQQNGRSFADDRFKCIFLNEIVLIWNNISLKYVPKGQIDNKSSGNGLVPNWHQAITWTNDNPVHRHIWEQLVVLGGAEMTNGQCQIKESRGSHN